MSKNIENFRFVERGIFVFTKNTMFRLFYPNIIAKENTKLALISSFYYFNYCNIGSAAICESIVKTYRFNNKPADGSILFIERVVLGELHKSRP